MNRIRRVRRMPYIYGNLQTPKRNWSGLFKALRVVLVIAIFAGATYAIWFSGWFTVKRVIVEGTHFTSPEAIKGEVPLGMNIWFISKDDLSSRVLQESIVQSVAIFRGIPDSLKVVVKEKDPIILWMSGSTTAALDSAGNAMVVYENSQMPPPTSDIGVILTPLPRVVDTKSLSIALNQQITSARFVKFVQDVQQQIAKSLPQVHPDHYEVVDTTYELTMIAKEGMQVQFDVLGKSDVQVRNLTRLVQQQKVALTEHVDLRISRWAYVQ